MVTAIRTLSTGRTVLLKCVLVLCPRPAFVECPALIRLRYPSVYSLVYFTEQLLCAKRCARGLGPRKIKTITVCALWVGMASQELRRQMIMCL